MSVKPERIFVVEDEALIAMELSDRLERRGYEVCGQAAQGERALEAIPESGAALVLMDINLAGALNGIETAARLRERYDVPVVFLTAYSDGRCLQGAGAAGAYGYLVKPFQIDELHATIQTALCKHAMEQRLRQSNADLEQFASAISHDLRQPIRAVSGHLQLLERRMPSDLEPNVREHLDFAQAALRRMDAMIAELLDYSRIGHGSVPRDWIDSREPYRRALEFLGPAIVEAGAEIEDDGEWPRIQASPQELTRLFQNLIGNALKFRDAERSVRIRIVSEQIGARWRVGVHDNGIGIEPRHLDRLFKIFGRLHSRARYEGLGMGLAICRRIVERHQGRIEASSEGEGHGSVFTFELPLNADQ